MANAISFMAMTISQTEFLPLTEGRIAFDSTGSGPLVVLVPGMGDLRSSYRFLVPLLVEAGHRVVTTDLRGHGDSDATFRTYGGEQTAEDIAALLRHLGEPALLVGNSLAAASAVGVAADHPELVRGIALLGPFVRNPNAGAAMMVVFRVMMLPAWASLSWKAYFPTLFAGTQPADLTEYVAKVIASLRRPGYARAFSLTTRTSHEHAELALPRVTTPSLVVMGDKDPDFPDPVKEANWIGTELGSTVAIVPEAGHYPQAQRPELVAAAILDFARGLPNA